jgi:hypothetical protein
MSNRDIDQLVQEVLRSTFANQEPHVLESRRGPREENQASDADGADRVKEPDFLEFCSDDGHDQSEDVDEDIISVVKLIKRLAFAVSEWFSEVSAYHEYACCWVAADEEAVDEHNTF